MLVEVDGDDMHFQAHSRTGQTVDAGVLNRGATPSRATLPHENRPVKRVALGALAVFALVGCARPQPPDPARLVEDVRNRTGLLAPADGQAPSEGAVQEWVRDGLSAEDAVAIALVQLGEVSAFEIGAARLDRADARADRVRYDVRAEAARAGLFL